ncbi:MAG TPA: SGNH/GDSL hydrolase family protein [Candidatus Limnocylindria bacterium]|jgi:lysophospholipase L1-like esterase|nr:SGNH/GDSL hydrolase family protein [Candidatus Limnocylindria bacterium]
MTNRILSAWIATAALLSPALAAGFQIHDGDRVVFLGDSITEQRLYTTYIEAYTLARHPNWTITFRNVGWGGDTAWLRQRAHPDEKELFAADPASQQKMVEGSVGSGLSRDVLPLRSTFVTVKFGMNDHSYQAFRPDIFAAYTRSQTQIAKVLEGAGARVAFLTPQPIEEHRPDPDQDVRNVSLRKFSDGLKEVAIANHATFVDQFDTYMKLMMDARAADPKAFIGAGDAVHPGPAGHTLMAWAVLKGLGATADVSRATVDFKTKSVTSERCRVEHLTVADGKVAFDRLDDALPMPIDERAQSALKLAPVLDELSRYELRVTGLPEGTYEITIDGESAAKASAESLAKGWNLSNEGGPVTTQGRELLKEVFAKNNLYFDRWRNVQLYSFPGWAKGPEIEARRNAELKRLDGEIAAAEAGIDATRKPKLHHFEVKPASP